MTAYQLRSQLHNSIKIVLAGVGFLILSFIGRRVFDAPITPWTIHLFPILSGILLAYSLLRYQRRQAHRTLNDNHFLRLYHNAPIMLHSMDKNGRLLHVSDHWLKVLGYQRQEVLGCYLTDFFTSESRQRAMTENYPKFYITGAIKDVAYQVLDKGGEIHDVQLSATAHYDDNGNFLSSQAVMVDITEKQRDEQRIHQLAYQDQLTKLPNRSGLELLLKQALHNQSKDSPLAVLSLDLDLFKQINDTLGSRIGNRVLTIIAERLKEHINSEQIVARTGGDAFVIVIPDKTSASALKLNAEVLLKRLSEPLHIDNQELFTSASIGIAITPQAGTDVDTLLSNANQAMYEVKRCGRNNYGFFSRQLSERALKKLQIETDLRRAVENDELRLFYQPQVCGEQKKVTGVEALIRWRHPQLGLISPLQFIPIAEESGQIIDIGRWVLKTACEQACNWHRQGLSNLRMSINVSPRQFQDLYFIDKVDAIVAETGVDPTMIELEITESVLMNSIQQSINTLTDLKVRGFNIAIDDFGTGYSSLTYLRDFPIDRLKIPREFLQNFQNDNDDGSLIEAIIALATSLNLGVVAEGVETLEQLQFIRQRCQCTIQGFYFAGPMAVPATTHFITNSSALQSADWSLDYDSCANVAAVSSSPLASKP